MCEECFIVNLHSEKRNNKTHYETSLYEVLATLKLKMSPLNTKLTYIKLSVNIIIRTNTPLHTHTIISYELQKLIKLFSNKMT